MHRAASLTLAALVLTGTVAAGAAFLSVHDAPPQESLPPREVSATGPGEDGVTLAPDVRGGDVERTFNWTWRGERHAWRLGLNESFVHDARAAPRTSDPLRYGAYVTDASADPAVARAATGLARAMDERGLHDGADRAAFVLAFVHGLRYTPDLESTGIGDHVLFPGETLARGGGDCEDLSVLYASILRALGMNAVLLVMDGHMAVGVDVPGAGARVNGYLYAETSFAGHALGERSDEYAHLPVRALDTGPAPVLHVGVHAEARHSGWLVRVTVWNNGTRAAEGVGVAVGLVDAFKDPRAVEAALPDLAAGASVTHEAWIPAPPGHVAEDGAPVDAVAWANGQPYVRPAGSPSR